MDVMVRSYKSLDEEEEAILSAFRVFDKEGSGKIDADELRHIFVTLGDALTQEEVRSSFVCLGFMVRGMWFPRRPSAIPSNRRRRITAVWCRVGDTVSDYFSALCHTRKVARGHGAQTCLMHLVCAAMGLSLAQGGCAWVWRRKSHILSRCLVKVPCHGVARTAGLMPISMLCVFCVQVTESLKLANIDKDGKIDYREFAKVLLPQPLPRR